MVKKYLAEKLKTPIIYLLTFLITFYSSFPIISYAVYATESTYDFKVKTFNLPEISPNQVLDVPIGLENTGDLTWVKDGSTNPKIQIGYTLNNKAEDTKTDLVSDVLNSSNSPDNLTGSDQEIKITAPATEGSYQLELFLYDKTNSKAYFASDDNKQKFSLVVTAPLQIDTTKPIGNIQINNGDAQTTSTKLKINLTASDPSVHGEVNSGISEYIISEDQNFSNDTWEEFLNEKLLINKAIPKTPGTHTFYVKFKDSVGNESEVYSNSIIFNTTQPTGGIEIDKNEKINIKGQDHAQDNDIKIHLSASSNVDITDYIISTDNDFSNDSWIRFKTPGTSVSEILEKQIRDKTGYYSFFVKYKNKYNEESKVYSSSIFYKKYDIQPKLDLRAKRVLFGGQMDLAATLSNLGEDTGYNSRFEIILPKGFKYLHALESIDGNNQSRIEPKSIFTNNSGLQVLIYEGIDDLTKGEAVSIFSRISVGGKSEGYSIGDIVEIPVKSQLFKRNDFKTGFEIEKRLTIELKPFTAEIRKENNEKLIDETDENKIKIKTNPEIDSDTKSNNDSGDPLVIEFRLDKGSEYDDGSQRISINGQEIDLTEYNVVFQYFEDLVSGNPILKWIFKEKVDVDLLVEIYFKTRLNKIQEQTILGTKFVEHEQKIEEQLKVEGKYNNDKEESKTYTEKEKREIIAKYFTIKKTSSPFNSNINQKVRYTIRIETSKEYRLSGIEITDKLSDGVNFSEDAANISYSKDLLLNIEDHFTNSQDGDETIIWRINSENGVDFGTVYEFSYDATIDSTYNITKLENDNRIFSGDYLNSTVFINGIWFDKDEGVIYDREETLGERQIEDTAHANNRLLQVNFSEGVKHSAESDYSSQLDIRVGDELDVYSEIKFPEDIPTNAFKLKIYTPAGTELKGSFVLSTDFSTVQPTKIDKGYLIDLGVVEPNKTFRIDYKLKVLDDPILKEEVKVKNLFRANYESANKENLSYRRNLILNLIEPKIQVSKRVVSGYLAKGEEATVEVSIKNIGSDTAYKLSAIDSVPTLTSLVPGSTKIKLGKVILDGNNFKIKETLFKPGSEIILTYKVITDNAAVVFGNRIDSTVIVSEYFNRSQHDPLLKRTYNSKTYNFTWKAKESLLVTEAPEVKVSRNKNFNYTFKVQPIGGAPVYKNNIRIDLSNVSDLGNINQIPYKVKINNKEKVIIASVINGVYTFQNIDLLPDQKLLISFDLKTSLWASFNKTYNTQIKAIGKNKLNEAIRVDGSSENKNDVDIDDIDNGVITIAKTDLIPPTGTISFTNNKKSISLTNKKSVDSITYKGRDNIGLAGARFSNDRVNWYALSSINRLSNDIKQKLSVSGDWNSWDGSKISSTTSTSTTLRNEGHNFRYMQLVDIEGNINVITGSILRDTTAPKFAKVVISPSEFDFSNPSVTGTLNNYINFFAFENFNNTNQVSGIGQYSYSFNGNSWSKWANMSAANNSLLLNFPRVKEENFLTIFLRVRDVSGNEFPTILTDQIQYKTESPTVSLQINNGNEFTNQNEVELTLDIASSKVNQVRFNIQDFCSRDLKSCTMTKWENLGTSSHGTTNWIANIRKYLNRFWEEGRKEVCVQLRDPSNNLTNIACDTISLDKTAPIGSILINNGDFQTDNLNTNLKTIASDPKLSDNSPGSGSLQMRFSKVGKDCNEINNSTQKTACESTWTTWINHTGNYKWSLENYAGNHAVYVQYRDRAGNVSLVYLDEIVYNSLKSSGKIIINNDNVFTNSKFVSLELFSDSSCAGCTNPVLMRFYKTNNTTNPPTPPTVSSQSDNQKGWTYWEEYQKTKSWNLDKNNLGKPNYGKKNVFVQYMFPNTDTSPVHSDSIIYAPYYGIEYSTLPFTGTKKYTINTIPAELTAQDQIQVAFNTKNTGSFTWPAQGENPVRITYTWTRTGGEKIIGALGAESEFSGVSYYRGNSTILPKNIPWDKTTGQIILNIDTPIVPGDYTLKIDTVHEGNAWFSEYGNIAPTYKVNVKEHPTKKTPTPGINPETGEILGLAPNTEFGIGNNGGIPFPKNHRNCADTYGRNRAGTTCYIGGILQKNSNHRYDYVIWGQQTRNPKITKRFNFISRVSYDHLLGQEVLVKVYYRNNFHQFSIRQFGVAPKSWISEFHGHLNDPKILGTIDVNRGMSFTIQPRLLNKGTAIWRSNEVLLIAVGNKKYNGGGERASPFYDQSTWHSRSRIKPDHNPSGYGFNSVAKFTFKINIPRNISYGIHKQCFIMGKQSGGKWQRWQKRDSFCITLNVKMTSGEEREFLCNKAQPVYQNKNKSSKVIGHLNKNDKFVITEDQTGWLKGYLPTNGKLGWISKPSRNIGNNYNCFSNIIKVNTPIPAPVFNVIPKPVGDKGYIINIGNIPVKDGPADSFNTITSIGYGTEVRVLGEANLPDRFGGWVYVRIDKSLCEAQELTNGQCEGWIPKGTLHHVNDPKDISVSLRPQFSKGHICGDNKQVRTGPGDWYPLAKTPSVSNNFNFVIIMKRERPDGTWYQIYLDDKESGPFNLNTGWIKGLDNVCEGIYYPVFSPACSGQLSWPFEKKWTITSGWRTPSRPTHGGIDIGAPLGVPVLAAADGYIQLATTDQHGGKYIDVVHPSLGIKTRYLHLSRIDKLSGTVKKGQQIGLNGSTGYSRGPHLHFAVFDLKTRKDLNPMEFLGGGVGSCSTNDDEQKNKRYDLAEPTLKNFLLLIQMLSKYHSDKTIVGLLFNELEPEIYWNLAAPQRIKYIPLSYSLHCKQKRGCLKETMWIINTIKRQMNYNGQNGGVTPLIGPNKEPINQKHLIAGLSQHYLPLQLNDMPYMPIILDFVEIVIGIDTDLGPHSRTYTGDLGGIIQSAVRKGNRANDPNQNNSEKFELENFHIPSIKEKNLKILSHKFWQGMLKNGDLNGNVDSFSINMIIKTRRLTLNDALEMYYSNHQNIYKFRYRSFQNIELNRGISDKNKFNKIVEKVHAFAVIFDIITSKNLEDIFKLDFSSDIFNATKHYSIPTTSLFYRIINIRNLEEMGRDVSNIKIESREDIYNYLKKLSF